MIKVTKVKYENTLELNYKHVTTFYIRDAFGDFIYFHTKDRLLCQQTCDKMYGKGKYVVRCPLLQKQDKPLTCR